jgi:hypothetical protein
MKTNSAARWFVRIRVTVLCLAIVGLVGIAFSLGESLAARIGQTSAHQTEGLQAPSVSISDLMAAAR